MSRRTTGIIALALFVLTFAFSFSMVSQEIGAAACPACSCFYECSCNPPGIFQGHLIGTHCYHGCSGVGCGDPCSAFPC